MSQRLDSEVFEEAYDPRARLGECVAQKWTLDEVLGVGGMAVVYAATHRNGHRTAIKMLLPETARDESLVRRFLREGYLANKVPHEGAVRVIDDGRAEDGSPFLVMERLFGESLDVHTRNRESAIDMRGSLEVMLGVLGILEAAHDVGVVHRDVKPANIFRTTQRELKLLDFGIAVLVESGRRSSATASGTIIGTPAFMAPEQARGRHELVGPRTDLWAVAASGLAMMLGGRLRPAGTASEELAMAALQPLPPATAFGEALGGRFGDVFDRALAFEPGDRFAGAGEMRAALEACRGEVLAIRLDAPATHDTLPLARETVVVAAPPMTVQGGFAIPALPVAEASERSPAPEAPAPGTNAPSPEAPRARSRAYLWVLSALLLAVVGSAAGLRWTARARAASASARLAPSSLAAPPPAAQPSSSSSDAPPAIASSSSVPLPATAGSARARPLPPGGVTRPSPRPVGPPSARRPDFMDER